MLNLAGPAYDFGPVLFAVLQECEHQRRALDPERAEKRLREIARAKLDEVQQSYLECGGDAVYWQDLEREVFDTALPQYVPAAIEQTAHERAGYGVWRRGDPLARGAMGLGGLALGAFVVALPLHPFLEDPFALLLAASGFLYPEIKRWFTDYRHSRLLNRLIVQAEAYQKDRRLHYVPHSRFDEALRTLTKETTGEEGAGVRRPHVAPAGDAEGPGATAEEHRGSRKHKTSA